MREFQNSTKFHMHSKKFGCNIIISQYQQIYFFRHGFFQEFNLVHFHWKTPSGHWL